MEDILEHRQQITELLKANLEASRCRMKQQADKKRSEREFQVGDWMYLKHRPHMQSSSRIIARSIGIRGCRNVEKSIKVG